MNETTPGKGPTPREEKIPSGQGSALDPDRLRKGLQAAFGPDLNADGATGADAFRSVVQLIGEDTGAVSRISLPEVDDEPSPLHRSWSESLDLPPQIGRYRVAGEIARGGVGSIYKARDEDLGRDVALKVLLGDYRANAEMTQRFMEEAQIGGQLQHPGIVPVHELGLFSGKQPYFAMKLVKGQTLARLLENRTDPAEDRLRFLNIFEQICQPLAYAHARAVIHRDLKPSNVMVGAFGEVQVMDWGLAKVLRRGGIADDRRDRKGPSKVSIIETVRSGSTGSESLAGSVLGTPAYMPPEQARGEVEELDERSDVFGLGAILCEILTGKPPYVGGSAQELHHQAKGGYLDDAMERLSSCGADPRVVELARHCLAFEPRDRPRDAGAVSQEISAYLESLEEQARRSELRAAKAGTRAVASIVSLLAIVTIGVSLGWVAVQRKNASVLATARAREAIGKIAGRLERAEASGDQGVEAWTAAHEAALKAESLVSDTGVDSEVRQELEGLLRSVESGRARQEFLGELRAVQGQVGTFRDIDREYARVFQEYLGDDLLSMPLEASSRILQDASPSDDLLYSLYHWALVRRQVGRDWDAIAAVAVKISNDPSQMRLQAVLASEDPVDVQGLVRSVEEEEVPPGVLTVLASWLRSKGEDEIAERLLRRVLESDPANWRANQELGDLLCFRSAGDCEEALQYYRVVLAVAPGVWSLLQLAWGYSRLGRYEESLLWRNRILAEYGSETPFFDSWFLQQLMECLDHPGVQHSPAALDELIGHVLKLREEYVPPEGIAALWTYWQVLAAAMDLRYGERALEEARRLLGTQLDEELDPFLLLARARLEFGAGQKRKAVRTLELARSLPGTANLATRRLREYRRAILPQLASCASVDAALDAPEYLISEGDRWSFLRGIHAEFEDPSWTLEDFDDSGWETGPSGFGYGDGDDATQLLDMRDSYTSVFLRKTFNLPALDSVETVKLRVLVDDGFVAWVNGRRVAHSGVVVGDEFALGYDPAAVITVEGDALEVEVDIGPAVREGENLIAIVGLNANLQSSDLTLIPELVAWRRRDTDEERERLDAFREGLKSQGDQTLLEYLEGRLLAREGRHAEAAERFRKALEHDRSDPLPFVRLWESLTASGAGESAVRVMREELARGAPTGIGAYLFPRPPEIRRPVVEGSRIRLEIGAPEDLDPSVKHVATRWQICEQRTGFGGPFVLDRGDAESLTFHEVPPGTLPPRTRFLVRARLYNSLGQTVQTDEVSFQTGDYRFELVQVDLSSVFTRDVVASHAGGRPGAFDSGGFSLVEEGVSVSGEAAAFGLPSSGVIGVHRLGSYAGRNAIRIDPEEDRVRRIAVPPRSYTQLRFLAASGQGDVDLHLELEYEDGSTSSHVLPVDDWCDDFGIDLEDTAGGGLSWGASIAIDGLQRYELGARSIPRRRDAALYEFTVEPTAGKKVRAVVIDPARAIATRPDRPDAACNIMALTGVVSD